MKIQSKSSIRNKKQGGFIMTTELVMTQLIPWLATTLALPSLSTMTKAQQAILLILRLLAPVCRLHLCKVKSLSTLALALGFQSKAMQPLAASLFCYWRRETD